MAFLQVYFNSELKFTAPLQLAATSIGRAADNDVVINNSGVSGHHAMIVREGDVFYIADNNSTNGVFVNGRRITREQLHYGDEITVFKHKLKFVAVDITHDSSTTISQTTSTAATANIPQDKTVIVDDEQLKAILQQQRSNPPYLVPVSGEQQGVKVMLSKQNFDIGKSKTCDLHVGGWFAPALSAVISRQSDGYYLLPEKRGKVTVNGSPVKERVKLHDRDELQVRGLGMSFHQPAAKS